MNSKSKRREPGKARMVAVVSMERQRGLAAILGAFAALFLVALALVGINVGSLYFAQRDLQKQAALAAAAGIQAANGCRVGGVPGSLDAVTARVNNALGSNSTTGSMTRGVITALGGQAGVQVGRADYSTGTYVFVPLAVGDPRIDSVRVSLSAPAPALFGTGSATAAPTLYASATSWQPAYGAFYLGTGLANLNTNSGLLLGPLLNALLGTNVDLAAINSAGLAQVQVNLAQLMVAANVTNLNDLANLNTNLTGALNILGQAVSGTGGGLISGLGNQAYNSGNAGPTQQYFGDVFNNVGGALNPTVNDVASTVPFVGALDLLTALAEDAAKAPVNGQPQPINLQPTNSFLNLLSIPGISTVQTFVTIIQPPQYAVGPALPTTQANSAQIQLGVRISVTLPLVLSTNLGVDLKVANATGTLTKLQCPASGTQNPSATVGVSTQVATLWVGPFDPSDVKHGEPLGNGSLLSVLGGLIANVTVKNPKPSPVTVGTAAVNSTGPYDTYTSTQGLVTSSGNNLMHETLFTAVAPDNTDTVGSSLILSSTINSLFSSLTSSNNLQVCILGLCVGSLVDPILNALAGLLSPVAVAVDFILQALMQLLGLQLGTATVTMAGATIGEPVLVSTCLPGTGINTCPVLP
jgi:uncharacterized membrane protein